MLAEESQRAACASRCILVVSGTIRRIEAMVRARLREDRCVLAGEALLEGIDCLRRIVCIEFAGVELNRHFDVYGLHDLPLRPQPLLHMMALRVSFQVERFARISSGRVLSAGHPVSMLVKFDSRNGRGLHRSAFQDCDFLLMQTILANPS